MRPKKYIQSRLLTICVDEKDVEFLDDHRGKMTRGDYLIESMYAIKNKKSDYLLKVLEENERLRKYNNNQNTKTENDESLIKFYEYHKIGEAIEKLGEINWKNLFEKNINLITMIKDHKQLESWCKKFYLRKKTTSHHKQ